MYKSEHVRIPYPLEHLAPGEARRAKGVSFHHGRFIQSLRGAAQACPNVTFVEANVHDLITGPDNKTIMGVICTPTAPDGSRSSAKTEPVSFYAPLTFAVNGFNCSLRKTYLSSTPPQVRSKFWGAVLRNIKLPRPEHGHVILGRGKPILLYQIDEFETRILVDVPLDLPAQFSKPQKGEKGVVLSSHRYLRHEVMPILPLEFQDEFRRALDEQRFKSMPNSWLPPKKNSNRGLAFIGDALNMRHPLTGGGMTVALQDVILVSQLLKPIPDLSCHSDVLSAFSTWHTERKSFASVVNTLAQALYSVFADSDPKGVALREGCFDYFLCGDEYVNGPVSMLAGLAKSPSLLLYHFFAVAFHSIRMAAWKSAARWSGTNAFFDRDDAPTPGQFSSSGAMMGMSSSAGGVDVAGARAAGCPMFANGAPPPSAVMPASHPSVEGADMSNIPAECPMSPMYGKSQTPTLSASPNSYLSLIFMAVGCLLLYPIAWIVHAIPLLYRACVVIGPVLLAELCA